MGELGSPHTPCKRTKRNYRGVPTIASSVSSNSTLDENTSPRHRPKTPLITPSSMVSFYRCSLNKCYKFCNVAFFNFIKILT